MQTTYGIILVNSKNKILACHPTRHNWNQWDIPKGGKDEHETPSDALYREFYEETGLGLNTICSEIHDVSLMLQKMYEYRHKRKCLYGFFGRTKIDIDSSIFKCHSVVRDFKGLPPFPEVDAYTWINYSDIDILHESQVELIKDINRVFNVFSNEPILREAKSNHYG